MWFSLTLVCGLFPMCEQVTGQKDGTVELSPFRLWTATLCGRDWSPS